MKMKISFDVWMQQVTNAVLAKIGFSVSDLPDVPFSDWYEDGVTPARAAVRVIKYAFDE
jgi:hypothetical protein